MSIIAVTTLGIGLSMDAFAVALGQGTTQTAASHIRRHALILAALFGLAQATMPLLGWTLGAAFQEQLHHIDHWIAFVLLAGIGIAMIRGALTDDDTPPCLARGWKLAGLAIATSIDAAAAGITLAMLGMPIALACAIIGVITFCLTYSGAMLGRMASAKLGHYAEIAGGAILLLLGLKILLSHLLA